MPLARIEGASCLPMLAIDAPSSPSATLTIVGGRPLSWSTAGSMSATASALSFSSAALMLRMSARSKMWSSVAKRNRSTPRALLEAIKERANPPA